MKLINAREQWVVEGMLIGLIHKQVPLDAQQMHAYYTGINYGSVPYKFLRRAIPFDRSVILTAEHRFIIVPMTPDIQVIPTEEHS